MAALVTDDVAAAGIAKAMARLQTEDEPGDWTAGMDASQLERAKASLRWAPGYYDGVEGRCEEHLREAERAARRLALRDARAFRRGDVVLARKAARRDAGPRE